jgi:hypothetical protein
MATDKKSFILYCDLIHTVNKLPDGTAGKLLKHILAYVNDLNPETEDLLVEVAFEPIKQAMKRDLKKWETEIDRKSQGAILGNLKRWHFDLYEKVESKELTLDEAQTIAKGRIPSHTDKTDGIVIKSIASIADSVNVSVNDSVSVNVNDNVNEIYLDVPTKVETPPKKKVLFTECSMLDFEPKDQNSFEIAKGFWQLFGKNLKEIGAPLANIKKANAKEWTRQIALMLKNEEATVDQLREVYDFLKVDEFWKPNVQSVPKLREKFTTIYSQSKKIKNESSSKGTGGASDAFKRRIFETLTGQTSNS